MSVEAAPLRISLACWPPRFPGGDLAAFADVARIADQAGLYSIHLGEHVLIGNRTDRYPFGEFEFGRDAPWPDPLICLAVAAGVTSRVRLSTGVLIAPLRPPGLLAKELATLDVLSGGRVEPVLGIGWQPEEYVACRVPWARRYALLEENLAFCRRAWEQETFSFEFPDGKLSGLTTVPRPVQLRVPVLLGLAPTARNAARIAAYADGWCPMLTPPDEIRAGVATIRHAFDAVGRSSEELVVRAPVPLCLTDDGRLDVRATLVAAGRLWQAGATVVSVGLPPGLRTMAELADTVVQIAAVAERRSSAG